MRRIKFRPDYRDVQSLARDISTQLNHEPTFSVTLATGTVATTVSNQLAGVDSVIIFMPTTSQAAAEIPTMYVSNQDAEEFTIAHTNSGSANRTFKFTIFG